MPVCIAGPGAKLPPDPGPPIDGEVDTFPAPEVGMSEGCIGGMPNGECVPLVSGGATGPAVPGGGGNIRLGDPGPETKEPSTPGMLKALLLTGGRPPGVAAPGAAGNLRDPN